MNELVTASIGLCYDEKTNQYYVQIITENERGTHHYFVPVLKSSVLLDLKADNRLLISHDVNVRQ